MKESTAHFIEGMQKPIAKLGIKELREREETWRALWSWIPDDVKYLVYRIGTVVRVVKRDWKGGLGELGEIKFEPKEYELSVYEKRYDETEGKFYYERKIVKIPSGGVMWLEFIQERELVEEHELPEVMGLEDVEDTQYGVLG